ncbi:cation:proton antiporter (plasmid) [Rhizobium sp. TRM96647]|uniref:cation:proton antiporter n=1 Tax=unclassified Rhizobium TaxID=2613769 RepID=UPI0021E75DC6|nr:MULTISPECIES: cation:proton antiporter [unclassified Rhizobium]MCV3735678.1 cation:proton antiporter [Rhizobium sp. TRM96647]MCV3757559.1 cation:proton antiporter [Rhizobium sp. TRM96650]
MTAETFAQTVVLFACSVALFLMCVAFFLTVWRVISGPTLPDRIVALDMLVAIAIGFLAVIAIKTGFNLYIDIAISLGLVGFLATVALARFVLTQGMPEDDRDPLASTAARHGKGPAPRKQRASRRGRAR